MKSRRFAILAGVLVALNLALWLAPQGLALRQAVINQLFGPRMIRAEVVVQTGGSNTQDFRLDRGVIISASGGSLVLAEQDGTTQTIPYAATTHVVGPKRFSSLGALRRGMRVLVMRPANGNATQIQVEAVASVAAVSGNNGRGRGRLP